MIGIDDMHQRNLCTWLVSTFISFCCACGVARSVGAQDNLTNVPDPDPAVQLAALRVADGYEVSLFASDPMIDPPIAMAWDERGRLWVATSTSYPQPVPGQVVNDKIFVLEDTNGDGVADRSTVFADKLLTPTGILFGDDGVYVANSTEILHLRDTDGDGRADARRVVLSGFGADDAHHLIHTFRWGPDGLFYFNQSVYIFSHVETPWGVRRLRGGGVWQFNPVTLELDVFARGLWNSWGYEVDRWGQSFATDGAGFQGIHFMFPDVAYNPATGVARVLEGLNPGDPKYSGLALLSGRHLADSVAGQLITNDYRANRIKRFTLTEDGSGFTAEQEEDLIWTDHYAFRPVDTNVGPDGALYFADWYNPIIQHGEVDFRDPRRDHRHGRIWRVTAKDRPLVSAPKLHGASIEELLDALRLPEDYARRQSKRLLRERGADAVQPKLDAWVRALDRDAPGATHDLLEALWTYQAIGVVHPPLLGELLQADDHRARAAALRVLLHWHVEIDSSDELLAAAVKDPHPRVRREALHVLARRTSAESARQALAVLNNPMDLYLDYALWHTMRALEPYWLPRFESDPDFFGDDARAITFALKSVEAPSAMSLLTTRYRDRRVPVDESAAVLDVIVNQGSPEDLDVLFDLALDGDARGDNGPVAHLGALESAARQRELTPTSDLYRVSGLLDAPTDSVRMHAARLAGLWKLKTLRQKLQTLVEQDGVSQALQRAALEGLAAMGDDDSRDYIVSLTKSGHEIPLRILAAGFLSSIDIASAASAVAGVLNEAPPETDPWPLFDAFIQKEGGLPALADALRVQPIPASFAQAGLDRVARRGDRFADLRAAFVASGATITEPKMDLDPGFYEFQRLEHDVKAQGNPARGEKIYRRPSLLCSACHAIGGGGGNIGPDLSAIGATAPTDYLIESLLKPEKAVKDGYALVRVVRRDGTLLNGNLVQDAGDALLVRDASGAVTRVPTSQIQEREILPGSLMPAGLTAQLNRDEFVDLVAYLSALGDEGPYRVSRKSFVRRWRVLQRTDATMQRLQSGDLTLVVADANLPWAPAYSTVAGELPLEDIPEIVEGDRRYSFVQFDVEVQQAGSVALGFDGHAGLSAWVGMNEVNLNTRRPSQLVVDLSSGVHLFTIAIDRAILGENPLQIELLGDESTARAAFVRGQ